MAYLFKQKLNLLELANAAHRPKRVLIQEPEEYLAALYQHYLLEHNFDVKHCPDLHNISKFIIEGFYPDVLVFCADANFEGVRQFLSQFSYRFPGVLLIATGISSDSELVRELMSAGVTGHINRKLTRPQDLAIVIKSMIQ